LGGLRRACRWSRTPQRQTVKISIDRPDSSPDIPLEANPQGLCLRWIARPAPTKLGHPSDQLSVSLFLLNKRELSQTKQIRHRDPVTAFQAELSLRCERGFRHAAMPCSRPPRIPTNAWRPSNTGGTTASRAATTSL